MCWNWPRSRGSHGNTQPGHCQIGWLPTTTALSPPYFFIEADSYCVRPLPRCPRCAAMRHSTPRCAHRPPRAAMRHGVRPKHLPASAIPSATCLLANAPAFHALTPGRRAARGGRDVVWRGGRCPGDTVRYCARVGGVAGTAETSMPGRLRRTTILTCIGGWVARNEQLAWCGPQPREEVGAGEAQAGGEVAGLLRQLGLLVDEQERADVRLVEQGL